MGGCLWPFQFLLGESFGGLANRIDQGAFPRGKTRFCKRQSLGMFFFKTLVDQEM